jgi:hypothetical protein
MKRISICEEDFIPSRENLEGAAFPLYLEA